MAHLEAIAGKSVTITATFEDDEGVPAAPDAAPVLTIYNRDRKVLATATLSTPESTGVYAHDYTVPKSVLKSHEEETEIYADIDGTMDGVEHTGNRHTITVTWT